MSTEITVLLLEAESLPSALEEHLAKRDVFVEHASGGDVAQMLPMIGPDLVVQSGTLDVGPTIHAILNEKSAAPLVIIADRAKLRELRENQDPAVHALIPADLPVAAIAHRLSTIARRSAEGSAPGAQVSAEAVSTAKARSAGTVEAAPLGVVKAGVAAKPAKVVRPSSAQKAVEKKALAPAPHEGKVATTAERGSLAPAPLAPLQQVKIVDSEETLRGEAEQAAREEAALREVEAEQRAVEAARQKSRAAAEEKSRQAAEQRRAELELKARQRAAELEERRREQAARLEERKREQEQKREERLREQERRAKERASLRVEAQRISQRPKAAENTPSEMKALDDLFPTATPEPATTRSSHPPEHTRRLDRTAAEDLEQTTQAVDISAFAPELDKRAQSQPESGSAPSSRAPAPPKRPSTFPKRPFTPPKRPSAPPPQRPSGPPTRSAVPIVEQASTAMPKSADFSAVKKTDDLSVIMPLPVDMRLDLAPKAASKPIRLALLDTDLTRADAVSAELRERGMKIHPVTPDPGRTRWPMLRRFAPQGLIVDEKSMPRGAAEWVETFRGDPFLRHVPVVLVRFSRLFDEASGNVTIDHLLPMIEHIGREEFALLSKLGPGHRVDLWLSQVAPYRLVEMLTKEDRNTRLDCKSDTERMVWHLGPGYAGRGKLADLKTDAPKKRLSPPEALTWLLGHEDCQIAVFEHSEPLAHASESVDAEGLLREMTEALGAPERHESVRPGALSQAQRPPSVPGLSPPPEAPTLSASNLKAAPSDASENESNSALRQAPPAPLRRPEVDPPADPSGGRKAFFSVERKEAFLAKLDSAVAAMKRGYTAYERAARSRLRPLEAKVPEPVLRHAPWAVPVLLVLLLLLIVLLTGADAAPPQVAGEAKPGSGPQANATTKVEKEKTEPEVPGEKANDDLAAESGSLWIVDSGNTFPSCEERLGAGAPKGLDTARSAGYWKNARRLLMVGNSEEAIESMCLAGLFDPAGPASEGLAEYYLGQRALAQAERWVKESLKADPERRKSKELLCDIENQKGNIDEARKLLLATMNLSGAETKKMEMTARKLRQDARLARKGGDLPRAERELRRAAILAPADAEIAIELGDTLLRREASVAAGKWAAHALKLDPNNSSAMLLAARVAETMGKKDKAREFYEMVPLGDPHHDEAQRRRGRL